MSSCRCSEIEECREKIEKLSKALAYSSEFEQNNANLETNVCNMQLKSEKCFDNIINFVVTIQHPI